MYDEINLHSGQTVYKHQNKYYRKVAPQNSLPEERLFACRELEIYRKNGIIGHL